MIAEDFIGTWALQSWNGVTAEGESVQPYGDAPQGYIIYTADGYMSAQIQGNGGEGVTGNGLFLAYGGPFSLADEVVTHHVKVASWERMIGSDQHRKAKISGRNLTLSASANDVVHTILWQKV